MSRLVPAAIESNQEFEYLQVVRPCSYPPFFTVTLWRKCMMSLTRPQVVYHQPAPSGFFTVDDWNLSLGLLHESVNARTERGLQEDSEVEIDSKLPGMHLGDKAMKAGMPERETT